MPELPFIFPDDPAPRWANAEKTKIDCRIIFPHIGDDPVDFTASAQDPGWEHSEKIFDILANGDLGIEVGDYIAPALPVPPQITDRQFVKELRSRGIISAAEAEAFGGSGTIPPAISDLLDNLVQSGALTEDEKIDARIDIASATAIERANPLVAILASGFGWDDNATDDFFRSAGAR